MEIKELCDKITDLYENKEMDSQNEIEILQSIDKIRNGFNVVDFSNDDLIRILETTKRICLLKKKGQ